MTSRQILLAGLALLCLLSLAAALDKSNGFNSKIKWLLPDELKALDLSSNTKPLLYLFSKPTCGACKRLKAEFTGTAGRQLVRASRDYLMINISGDEENNKFGKDYQPDGAYIPRMLYAQPDGTLRPDVKNPKAPEKYGYFYSDASQVLESMRSVHKELTKPAHGEL